MTIESGFVRTLYGWIWDGYRDMLAPLAAADS
jgi:hypothetical protein